MESESTKYLLTAANQALESRGAIRSLRAQLLAELFSAMEEKPASNLATPPEALLINELICEYLSFSHYSHTLSVFMAEADLRGSSRLTRAAACSLLGITTPQPDDAIPLLYILTAANASKLPSRPPSQR